MNKNNLSDFWENTVVKSDKHFVETLSQEKINRMTSRVNEFIFSKLDFSNINTVIDWGCGGGLFAKILSEKANVILADISTESLNKAEEYLKPKSAEKLHIPDNLDNIKLPEKQVDLLFSHTVIHHFPSLEYWHNIFDIWTNKIRPKYFGLQIKIGNKTSERANYFTGKNYLNALYLNENEFVTMFEKAGYKKINTGYKINTYKNPDLIMKVGYFVFEKI